MASFRDREKIRQTALKINRTLFSDDALADGCYRGKPYPFCLGGSVPGENLYVGIRDRAVGYFREREIRWHAGERRDLPCDLPSRHLCCSQSMCVNTLFPIWEEPTILAALLSTLGYPISELLPFNPDGDFFKEPGYVAFEWIGLKNYLCEHLRGKKASDWERTRGAGFTSADFAFRFKRTDGRIQIVLGEWKYTENYPREVTKQFSKNNTDRLIDIYDTLLRSPDCPIKWSSVGLESLFFDPFDQMMRLQLLAGAMEGSEELGATIVSVLHVAPSANRELMCRITSPNLAHLGRNIHEVWSALTGPQRFKGVYAEEVIRSLAENSQQQKWADYMRLRYGGMA